MGEVSKNDSIYGKKLKCNRQTLWTAVSVSLDVVYNFFFINFHFNSEKKLNVP